VTASEDDHARVRELLGREPRGRYEVVVRDNAGDPVVLRNAPLLDDGTPMPTLYWLIGTVEGRRIGQIESAGGVNEAEADVDSAELEAAHARYALERDELLAPDHAGPRPSGGVGGTRTGVKCLHAHWAWHLAGGDDPVGTWIEQRLADDLVTAATGAPSVELAQTATTVRLGDGAEMSIPWGARNLTERWLADADPPRPEGLTNALGTIADHLDDVLRAFPALSDVAELEFFGQPSRTLAQLEVGTEQVAQRVPLDRQAAEEIFRIVATETATARADNPGLPSEEVDTIVATCCIVLAFMRGLHLDDVTLLTQGVS
jgi:hypothetical protein